MRICFIAPRIAPDLGGVAASAGRITAALAALGHEVVVYATTRSLPPGAETIERIDGVERHRLGAAGAEDLTQQHLLALLEDRHRRYPFEATWGHYLLPCGYLAVLFARLVGIPAIASARGNDVDRLLFPPGDFARLAWTAQQASAVATVSDDLSAKLRAAVPQARCHTVPNAVDTAIFCPAPADPALRSRLGIPATAPVVGFCGELRHKKGAPLLLEAMAGLGRSHQAWLLVIGELRPRDREHLDRLAADDPEAHARVVITGHLEDPAVVGAHLRHCDAVAMPSWWDGLPNALLEAMACGIPVVASRVGGIPEVVRDGIDGILLQRDELGRLDEALASLLDADPAERRALGERARQRVLEAYGPANEAAALRGLLASIAS